MFRSQFRKGIFLFLLRLGDLALDLCLGLFDLAHPFVLHLVVGFQLSQTSAEPAVGISYGLVKLGQPAVQGFHLAAHLFHALFHRAVLSRVGPTVFRHFDLLLFYG